MVKPLLSIEYLRQRLRYEPETGKLFWLDYEGVPQSWKARWVGKEAFTYVSDQGYRHGCICTIPYRAHRVAWAIYHGMWPTNQIDHVNGVRADNRIVNLREVSNQDNLRNATLSKKNTSGTTGVTWDRKNSMWKAQIMVDGRCIHLGYFDNLEEAAAARAEASRLYGFTERHGLPANVGEACD